MTTFSSFLQDDVFKELTAEPPVKTAKVTDRALKKFSMVQPDLITIFNHVNPFLSKFTYESLGIYDLDNMMEKTKPYPASWFNRLRDDQLEIVFEKWNEGISATINEFKHLMQETPGTLTAEQLHDVFALPFLQRMRAKILRDWTGVSRELVVPISIRAAKMTNQINQDAKNVVKMHCFKTIISEEIPEGFQEGYADYQYLPIDDLLMECLESHPTFPSCKVLWHVEKLLPFAVSVSKETVLTKSIPLFTQLLAETKQQRKKWEQMLDGNGKVKEEMKKQEVFSRQLYEKNRLLLFRAIKSVQQLEE